MRPTSSDARGDISVVNQIHTATAPMWAPRSRRTEHHAINMTDPHTIVPKSPTPRPEQRKDLQGERKDLQGERAEPQELTLSTLHQQVSSIAGEVGELARLVRGGARGAVASAAGRVGDVREETVERAKELEERAGEWMRERPMETALLSMGVGALLWSLVRRS